MIRKNIKTYIKLIIKSDKYYLLSLEISSKPNVRSSNALSYSINRNLLEGW